MRLLGEMEVGKYEGTNQQRVPQDIPLYEKKYEIRSNCKKKIMSEK